MAEPRNQEDIPASIQQPSAVVHPPAQSEAQDSRGQAEPWSNRPEARAAIYGLLGAIIGGLATFGGAYWTGHQSQAAAQTTSERSSCVTFAAAAAQYQWTLQALADSVDQGGQAYNQARASLIAQIPRLYSDSVQVTFVANMTISRDAAAIANLVL
jgi:hypothetical protein